MPAPRADDPPTARHAAIDGWRGVAASLVVLAHAVTFRFPDVPGTTYYAIRYFSGPMAETGVQIFFVISGYIITSLLLREEGGRGRISIAAFYARRACRIMPPLAAYYLTIVGLASVGLIALPGSSLLSSASFTCNTGIVDCDWWVAHTWSLAVEEQFYLVWPLLFATFAAVLRIRLLLAALAICTLGVILQTPVAHSNFTSFACIATGAIYATSPTARRYLAKIKGTLPWLVVLAVLMVGPISRAQPVFVCVLPLLILYLIFTGNTLRWVRAVLESKPLQLLGLGSYSLYLWQQLFLARPDRYLSEPFSVFWLPAVVVASIWLVEKPFIRLGRRWSKHVERAPRPE